MAAFLGVAKTAVLTTVGRDGWPHSAAMWFLPEIDGSSARVVMWTYAKSQKARNAQRDPRAALLVERGERYDELRGVLVRGHLGVVHDRREIADIGMRLYGRYVLGEEGGRPPDAAIADIERQARKRIGLVLPFEKVASWDHRKLSAPAGAYSTTGADERGR